MEERRRHCEAHEEFISAIASLTTEFKSFKAVVKFCVGAMLSITLLLASLLCTFSYKASTLYAQVQVNQERTVNHIGRSDAHGMVSNSR